MEMSARLTNVTNMVDYIRVLCEWVTDANLTALNMAQAMGTVDDTQLGTLYVRPSHPEVTAARVAPGLDTPVSHIEIELTQEIDKTELVAAFGDYGTPPAMPGRPLQMAFQVDVGAADATATVFATLEGEGASQFMIRRDMRL